MENALSILILLAVLFYILVKFQRIRDAQEERARRNATEEKVVVTPIEDTEGLPIVAEALKTAVPTAAGLFPHEISLLGHLSNPRARKNITQAWLSCYPMRDPNSVLDRLVDRGFAKWDGKRVRPTEKGLKEIEENEYIFYCQSSNYFNVWEMNRLMNNADNSNPKHFKWRDLVWQRLMQLKNDAVLSINFSEVARLDREMGYFLRDEGRNQGALQHFVRSAFIEANDLGHAPFDPENKDLLNYWLKTNAETHSPFVSTIGCSILPPYALDPIVETVRRMELPIEKLRKIVLDELLRVKQVRYPELFFTTEELTEIICYSVFEDADKLKAIYKIADERLQKETASIKSLF